MSQTKLKALRAMILTFTSDPFTGAPGSCYRFYEDGLIVLKDGKIYSVDTYTENRAAETELTEYPGCLITAGFIDCHVHYPQTQMIGAYGEHLLEWLDKYTFVTEQQFSDRAHAEGVARVFLKELLRAGTTTAAVYCTVHPQSVDAFFSESSRYNTRMIAGKVLMDRHAPDELLDDAETGYIESQVLIERWHGNGRQLYCITPRFAPTSTAHQLDEAGRLWRENPGTYMQTHLCETQEEVTWVNELFPERSNYLDVYHHAGLTGPRAIFGHAIHMSEQDFQTCHDTGSALAHCPTSNLFLGSGLFRLFDARNRGRPVRVGLGTDLGAGTSFSQLQTLGEAYKVSTLNGTRLTALEAFWLATRGGAEALYLDDRIGSVEEGYEADLTVLDFSATPLLRFRQSHTNDLIEKLFVLMTLGDDRCVRATWVAGECVYDRDRRKPFSYSS
ncbi:TPA: guanine deaminase [Klebsiella pneumoniae]